MLPSQQAMVNKLSKLQREFLIEHHNGMRPFRNSPIENTTRGSLIARKLITYHPPLRTLIGKPEGTVLTDPLGREAICMVLGAYADALVAVMHNRNALRALFNPDRQLALLKTLTECSAHWRLKEPADNLNGMAQGVKP
jgi:hypothetical protein